MNSNQRCTYSVKTSNVHVMPRKYWKFEDTKEVIRICKSKKNRQYSGQKKKYKRTNNDLQIIHIKLKIE